MAFEDIASFLALQFKPRALNEEKKQNNPPVTRATNGSFKKLSDKPVVDLQDFPADAALTSNVPAYESLDAEPDETEPVLFKGSDEKEVDNTQQDPPAEPVKTSDVPETTEEVKSENTSEVPETESEQFVAADASGNNDGPGDTKATPPPAPPPPPPPAEVKEQTSPAPEAKETKPYFVEEREKAVAVDKAIERLKKGDYASGLEREDDEQIALGRQGTDAYERRLADYNWLMAERIRLEKAKLSGDVSAKAKAPHEIKLADYPEGKISDYHKDMKHAQERDSRLNSLGITPNDLTLESAQKKTDELKKQLDGYTDYLHKATNPSPSRGVIAEKPDAKPVPGSEKEIEHKKWVAEQDQLRRQKLQKDAQKFVADASSKTGDAGDNYKQWTIQRQKLESEKVQKEVQAKAKTLTESKEVKDTQDATRLLIAETEKMQKELQVALDKNHPILAEKLRNEIDDANQKLEANQKKVSEAFKSVLAPYEKDFGDKTAQYQTNKDKLQKKINDLNVDLAKPELKPEEKALVRQRVAESEKELGELEGKRTDEVENHISALGKAAEERRKQDDALFKKDEDELRKQLDVIEKDQAKYEKDRSELYNKLSQLEKGAKDTKEIDDLRAKLNDLDQKQNGKSAAVSDIKQKLDQIQTLRQDLPIRDKVNELIQTHHTKRWEDMAKQVQTQRDQLSRDFQKQDDQLRALRDAGKENTDEYRQLEADANQTQLRYRELGLRQNQLEFNKKLDDIRVKTPDNQPLPAVSAAWYSDAGSFTADFDGAVARNIGAMPPAQRAPLVKMVEDANGMPAELKRPILFYNVNANPANQPLLSGLGPALGNSGLLEEADRLRSEKVAVDNRQRQLAGRPPLRSDSAAIFIPDEVKSSPASPSQPISDSVVVKGSTSGGSPQLTPDEKNGKALTRRPATEVDDSEPTTDGIGTNRGGPVREAPEGFKPDRPLPMSPDKKKVMDALTNKVGGWFHSLGVADADKALRDSGLSEKLGVPELAEKLEQQPVPKAVELSTRSAQSIASSFLYRTVAPVVLDPVGTVKELAKCVVNPVYGVETVSRMAKSGIKDFSEGAKGIVQSVKDRDEKAYEKGLGTAGDGFFETWNAAKLTKTLKSVYTGAIKSAHGQLKQVTEGAKPPLSDAKVAKGTGAAETPATGSSTPKVWNDPKVAAYEAKKSGEAAKASNDAVFRPGGEFQNTAGVPKNGHQAGTNNGSNGGLNKGTGDNSGGGNGSGNGGSGFGGGFSGGTSGGNGGLAVASPARAAASGGVQASPYTPRSGMSGGFGRQPVSPKNSLKVEEPVVEPTLPQPKVAEPLVDPVLPSYAKPLIDPTPKRSVVSDQPVKPLLNPEPPKPITGDGPPSRLVDPSNLPPGGKNTPEAKPGKTDSTNPGDVNPKGPSKTPIETFPKKVSAPVIGDGKNPGNTGAKDPVLPEVGRPEKDINKSDVKDPTKKEDHPKVPDAGKPTTNDPQAGSWWDTVRRFIPGLSNPDATTPASDGTTVGGAAAPAPAPERQPTYFTDLENTKQVDAQWEKLNTTLGRMRAIEGELWGLGNPPYTPERSARSRQLSDEMSTLQTEYTNGIQDYRALTPAQRRQAEDRLIHNWIQARAELANFPPGVVHKDYPNREEAARFRSVEQRIQRYEIMRDRLRQIEREDAAAAEQRAVQNIGRQEPFNIGQYENGNLWNRAIDTHLDRYVNMTDAKELAKAHYYFGELTPEQRGQIYDRLQERRTRALQDWDAAVVNARYHRPGDAAFGPNPEQAQTNYHAHRAAVARMRAIMEPPATSGPPATPTPPSPSTSTAPTAGTTAADELARRRAEAERRLNPPTGDVANGAGPKNVDIRNNRGPGMGRVHGVDGFTSGNPPSPPPAPVAKPSDTANPNPPALFSFDQTLTGKELNRAMKPDVERYMNMTDPTELAAAHTAFSALPPDVRRRFARLVDDRVGVAGDAWNDLQSARNANRPLNGTVPSQEQVDAARREWERINGIAARIKPFVRPPAATPAPATGSNATPPAPPPAPATQPRPTVTINPDPDVRPTPPPAPTERAGQPAPTANNNATQNNSPAPVEAPPPRPAGPPPSYSDVQAHFKTVGERAKALQENPTVENARLANEAVAEMRNVFDRWDAARPSKEADSLTNAFHHEVRNVVAPMNNAAEILRLTLENGNPQPAQILRLAGILGRGVDNFNGVNGLFSNPIPTLRDNARERNQTLQLQDDWERRLGELSQHIPPTEISIILMNLVGNSFKYGNANGTTNVELNQDDDSISIVVRDNGPGMSPETLARVRDGLRAVSNRTDVNSTGDGLMLVSHIVRQLGGERTVESNQGGPNSGTTFRIRIPKRRTP